jgi:integrase
LTQPPPLAFSADTRLGKQALVDAKLDHRPLYQCRHTFATLALAAGADLY